jgi:hypothetical protein
MKRKSMLFLLYTAVALLVSLVAISVQYAPIFTMNILVVFTVIICYVLTEDWTTHDAIEFENRFWTFMAGMLARACVFCSDSPLKIKEDRSLLAWMIVIFSSYGAHIYDRHLKRLVLSRVPKIPRVTSSTYDLSSRVNARTKLAELKELQDMLDNKYISSTFQNIFNLGKVLHIENQIVDIFSEADKDELNLILSTAKLGHIFYKVKDHKFVQQFNRTKLLHVLAVDRLSELNITAKTMLLDAFQKMKLSAHSKSDSYVKNIITSTKGDQLSELKSLSDCKGDINSFHKLVYRDIESTSEKSSVLNHIKKQAMIQEAHNKIGSRAGKQRGLLAWRKILSDVDDTLTCSGGVWPAGMDTRYPRKSIYPGVLAFYRELDLGITGDDHWDATARVGNLVFLSARPHLYKEVSEAHNYAKFRDLQDKRGLYTSPTLLTGSVSTGTNFIVGGSPEPLAVKKFENLSEYLAIYPEFSCILIGDNGQGDVRAAEMVMDDADIRENLTRSYIHLVQPLYQTHTLHQRTKMINNSKICYFTDYIHAAMDAYNNKLIKLNGLRRIMEEAIHDFHHIPLESWATTQDTGFAAASSAPMVLSENEKREQTTKRKSKRNASITGTVHNQELKIDARMRELNLSIYQANKVLIKEGLSPVKLMRFKSRFLNGSLVKTFMGNGVVTRFRDSDGVYEVLLQWDCTGLKPPIKAFFQGSAMKNIPPPLNPSSTVRRFRGIAQPVVLRSAVIIPQVIKETIKREGSSTSYISSNRSSPATVTKSDERTSSLTLAAVARHTIIAGTKEMTKDIGTENQVINTKVQQDLSIEKALEVAFVPSALARAPGRKLTDFNNINNNNNTSASYGRARTVSTSSDDKLSSTLTGRVKDPEDRLCDCRGAIAWTPYGVGVVKDYRDKDDMVLVELQWGSSAYIGRLQVIQLTDPSETLSYIKVTNDDDDDDDDVTLSGNSISLIHGNNNGNFLINQEVKDNTITSHYNNDLEQNTVATKGTRPSLFPSWLPFLGSNNEEPNENNTEVTTIKKDKSERKSIKHAKFGKLHATTLFGKSKIISVWVCNDINKDKKFTEVMIEVEFLDWKMADGSFSKGFFSPSSVYVQIETKKGNGIYPIGEEVDVSRTISFPVNEEDNNKILLSSHPIFTKFMNSKSLD